MFPIAGQATEPNLLKFFDMERRKKLEFFQIQPATPGT